MLKKSPLVFLFIYITILYYLFTVRTRGGDGAAIGADKIVTFIDDPKDMWKLRELVGSLHRAERETDMLVVASLNDSNDLEEISSWLNVTAVNSGLVFLGQYRNDVMIGDVKNVCERLAHSFREYLFVPIEWSLIKYNEPFLKGCRSDPDFYSMGFGKTLPDSSTNHNSQQNKCWLKHRQAFIKNPVTFSKYVSKYSSDNFMQKSRKWAGKKMALMVPTYNKDQNDESSLTKVLIPSLLKTINPFERKTFLTTIYVGYDGDDLISRVSFDKFFTNSTNIIVKLVRLPAMRWATAMWNSLYEDALNDGNHYFFQLGDDIEFHNMGWMTILTETLDEYKGFGMVGPNDKRWDCKILTQAMVTRKHYEIFGWFYPPEIKDWFSDNWLQKTYESVHRSFCSKSYRISNRSDFKQRYSQCDNLNLANMYFHKYLKLVKKQ